MPYLLDQFERVVEHIGNPKKCNVKLQFKNEKQLDCTVNLFNLKQGLLHLATSKALPGIVCQEVRLYQNSSIRMLKYLHDKPDCCRYSERCWNDVHHRFANTLIGFINFLYMQFPEYFDKELVVPELYYDRYRARFKGRVEKILKLEVDTEQLEVIKQVVFYFKELGYTNCSFRKIWYLDKLLVKINTKVCNSKVADDKFEGLVRLIISYNFNSSEIYNQIIEGIKRNLIKEIGISAKIDRLQWYKKHVSQIMVVKTDGFMSNTPSLKTLIVDWLKKELNSYNYEYHISEEKENIKVAKQTISKSSKIQTNLSVPVIACILRQFIETGLILTENKKETIRIFSRFVKSKNNDNISYKSLNNKYFDIEESTYQSTKQLFLKLYKSIK